ncbi:hypothetical protein CsSME_00035993 [Camellia sinensis var. sinensis]
MNTAWLKKVASRPVKVDGCTKEVAGRPLLFVLLGCSRKGIE